MTDTAKELDAKIRAGSHDMLGTAARISEGDPPLATAQLLYSAAVLAFTSGISEADFRGCFELAISETFTRDTTPKRKHRKQERKQ